MLPAVPYCVPRQVMLVITVVKELWTFVLNNEFIAEEAEKEAKKIKLMRLCQIRGRLLKQEGFYALHGFGAWAIYRESIEATKAERQKASCRLLGRFVSGRSKRAMATRFVRWQGT